LETVFKTRADWLPAFCTGLLSSILFILIGHTPIIRALGLALVAIGITLTLQRFGAILAVIAGMTLSFTPAFWSQTGGDTPPPIIIGWLLVMAVIVAAFMLWRGWKLAPSVGVSVVIFVAFFEELIGTPRSLRITTVVSAWLFYLLVDLLMAVSPRPGDAHSPPQPYHFWGLLMLLVVGMVNEPLFVLFIPGVGVGLGVTKPRLPTLYWFILIGIMMVGLRAFIIQYIHADWWLFPAGEAELSGVRVPYIMIDGWRQVSRWAYIGEFISGQFSLVGLLLSVVGLARLARWYPAVGVASLMTFAGYALFGLVYFGRDNLVLMLPLLMIQVIWITYAVYTLGDWLKKSAPRAKYAVGWLIAGVFALLPFALFLGVVAPQIK
jgi:hypothetical protein